MDETLNDDTLSERPTLGRTVPEEKEPEGPARTWTDEDAERETMKRPVSPEEMTLAGRYKVLRRLGEGGMGSVWLAEDLKLDSRKVAIKMLPAVLAGKKAAYKQVKQEALMAMKLSHPNIATVRAFEEEDGNPFLVMDYIEGQGLDDILAEKGKLSEEETLRLLTPVAAALDYAHGQGVVHRDVKPGNVIVRKDGTPFVLDFGIAREIQETMTRVTGKFSSGTLLYMSPEQLRGRAPKAAQDVYSFAVVAYECLTGRPPFYRGAVEDQIKNEPPEDLKEGVASEGLRKGIMAGLAKVPEERPGSCAGVLANGGASQGGASTPCAPENGTTAGRVAGRAAGKAAGGTARPEGEPHQGGGMAERVPTWESLPVIVRRREGRRALYLAVAGISLLVLFFNGAWCVRYDAKRAQLDAKLKEAALAIVGEDVPLVPGQEVFMAERAVAADTPAWDAVRDARTPDPRTPFAFTILRELTVRGATLTRASWSPAGLDISGTALSVRAFENLTGWTPNVTARPSPEAGRITFSLKGEWPDEI